MQEHREHLERSGERERRRVLRARREIETLAVTALRERMGELSGHADLDRLAGDVVAGRTDPFRAADTLLDTL